MALQSEQRARRRRGDAVLARARFGHDASLPHAPGQQRLAERVVDLVRARMRQVFALEQNPHSRSPRLSRPTGLDG